METGITMEKESVANERKIKRITLCLEMSVNETVDQQVFLPSGSVVVCMLEIWQGRPKKGLVSGCLLGHSFGDTMWKKMIFSICMSLNPQ